MFAAGKTAGVSAGGGPADPQFNYVTMLLHGDGTNGAQNNTFIDSSSTGATVTRTGNTTQGSFSPFGSNWSNFFDGSGDYLSAGSNAAFAVGTGDFTFQTWVFPTAYTSPVSAIFDTGSGVVGGRFSVVLYASGQVYVDSNANLLISSSTLPLNTWTFISIIRSSGTMTMYFNGTSVASASVTNNFTETQSLIGKTVDNYSFQGYISNLRLVKGTALSNTVPTTPLTAVSGTSLLTCQSSRFIDNSTNNFTITKTGDVSVQRFNPNGTATQYSTTTIGGAGYFDGSSQLSFSTNAGYAFGTGDFTAECFYYATSNPGYRSLIETRASNGTSNGWALAADSGGAMYVYAAGFILTGISVVLNTWNHVAFTRSGSTQYLFLNGVLVSSTATTRNYSDTNLGVGGVAYTTGEYWTGYLSNVRLIKGTCLYTTTFTPPTAPLTAVTNTTLLLNTSNAGIFDNAMINNLETVGNAQITTSFYKYGTGSLAFDGSGDWLLSYAALSKEFGSGAFTIECWAYITDNSTRKYIISAGISTATHYNFALELGDSGVVNMWASSNGTSWNLVTSDTSEGRGTTTIPLNQWNHVAMVRASNGTFTSYLNGVLQCTVSGKTAAMISQPTNPLNVGKSAYTGSFGNFNGYIDDLRITNGYARYSSNFTPPTAAFPNIGPN